MGTLPEDQYTFFYHSSVLLRMRNDSGKRCRKNQTHVSYSVIFFLNRTVYERMWKNTVEPGRPHIIWRMRVTSRIPMATNTHSVYVAFLVAHLNVTLYVHSQPC
jgi:hypothetical protein